MLQLPLLSRDIRRGVCIPVLRLSCARLAHRGPAHLPGEVWHRFEACVPCDLLDWDHCVEFGRLGGNHTPLQVCQALKSITFGVCIRRFPAAYRRGVAGIVPSVNSAQNHLIKRRGSYRRQRYCPERPQSHSSLCSAGWKRRNTRALQDRAGFGGCEASTSTLTLAQPCTREPSLDNLEQTSSRSSSSTDPRGVARYHKHACTHSNRAS